MQLVRGTSSVTAMPAFGSLAHCTQCGDSMVAPLMSEFVAAGEIRHHWVCESCGEVCCTAIALIGELPE